MFVNTKAVKNKNTINTAKAIIIKLNIVTSAKNDFWAGFIGFV